MDQLSELLLFGVSGLLIFDFSRASIMLFRLANQKEVFDYHGLRDFIRGIAHLFATEAILTIFWMLVIIVGQSLDITGTVLLLFVSAYAAICIIAIIGRRRWWERLIDPIQEVETSAPEQAQD